MTAQAPEVTGIRARTVAPLPGLRGSATPQPSGERSPSRVRAGKSVAGVELRGPRRGRGEGSTGSLGERAGKGWNAPDPRPHPRACAAASPAPLRPHAHSAAASCGPGAPAGRLGRGPSEAEPPAACHRPLRCRRRCSQPPRTPRRRDLQPS